MTFPFADIGGGLHVRLDCLERMNGVEREFFKQSGGIGPEFFKDCKVVEREFFVGEIEDGLGVVRSSGI